VRLEGWRLFGVLAALLTALFAAAFAGFGTDEAGLRALLRFTARVSFLVFVPVYVAAPLRRLWPVPGARWLVRNRRHLGVSFAWAHGLHGLAIAMLAVLLGDAFEVDPVTLVVGGLAYALLAGMTITSFDRTARWLGPHRWRILHRAGLHTLWFVFAFDWTVLAIRTPGYLPFALAVWAAALLRLLAWRARHATAVAEPGEGGGRPAREGGLG